MYFGQTTYVALRTMLGGKKRGKKKREHVGKIFYLVLTMYISKTPRGFTNEEIGTES